MTMAQTKTDTSRQRHAGMLQQWQCPHHRQPRQALFCLRANMVDRAEPQLRMEEVCPFRFSQASALTPAEEYRPPSQACRSEDLRRTCKFYCLMRGLFHGAHIGQCIQPHNSPDLQRVILQVTPPRRVENFTLLEMRESTRAVLVSH